jgi:hypothetical protein
VLAVSAVTAALAFAACSGDGEHRPQVDVIGTGSSGSVSASGTTGSVSASGAPVTAGSGSLTIPTGQTPETEGPTASDGIYTPTTNREIYQKISTDYQEIVKLTNVVNEGQALPAADILLLYEAGMHTRIGTSSRSIRGWAREAARTTDFPDAVAFYQSATFLDTPVNDAIAKARTAEKYADPQRRQAIQKGILRILYHWSKHYMQRAATSLSPGLVDEAWAIYVGEQVNGEYPNSVAATALSREENFGRAGSLDKPLREAMSRAQQAAEAKDQAAYNQAARDVYSRFNAIFYLSTVRYLGQALDRAGTPAEGGVAQVEGLSYYQSIQPEVAKANGEADKALVTYFTADPASLTAQQRDAALAALNGTASMLLLQPADLVNAF